MISSILQGLPSIWTGMIALVRGVIRASILVGSIVKESSISARTGTAFIIAMVEIEAIKV